MSSIYHQPLWLQPTDAARIAQQGMLFMRAFNCAASRALEKSVPRFKVMPKFHFFAHIVHSMRRAARMDQVSLNALAYACQLDEDFVGRVSGQSRNVSIRNVHERTLQRYCLNLALRW